MVGIVVMAEVAVVMWRCWGGGGGGGNGGGGVN